MSKVRHSKFRRSSQRGSALVLAVSMSVIVSMGVIYVITRTNNNRSQATASLERTASFYATEASRQQAQAAMSDFVTERMQEAYDPNDWAGAATGGEHFLSPDNQVNGGINVNNFFDTITEKASWQNLKQSDSNGRSHQYKYFYFNDANRNEQQDPGEEGFVLVSAPASGGEAQTYTYRYNVTAIGKSGEREERILLTGDVQFGLSQPSFAQFALFTDTHRTASGSDLWFTNGSVFDGPVHTNGNNNSYMHFAANVKGSMDSATFKGKLTSSSTKIAYLHYDNKGNQVVEEDSTTPLSNKNPSSKKGVTPIFEDGYERGKPEIDLPENSFSQARAALGGDSTNQTSLSNKDIRKSLGLTENNNAVPGGVYTPSDASGNATGGIYIQGDVDEMIMSVDANGKQQIYIRQAAYTKGSGKNKVNVPEVKKTITIDPAAKTMVVKDMKNNTTTTLQNASRNILHVEGDIKSIGGPSRQPSNSKKTEDAPPAIQKEMALTVSSTGDIVVQRDLKYQDDPRGADGQFGGGDDNLKTKNMLGLFSSGGDVRVGTSAPDNMSIHASIMAASNGAQFTVDNYTSRAVQGQLNVLGGIIQNYYGASGTFNANGPASGFNPSRIYDRRFGQAAPPFFPTTSEPPNISEVSMTEIDWKKVGA